MKTTSAPIELLVSFLPDSDPPVGTVRDSAGSEQRFEGWLGLLQLLEKRGENPARKAAPVTGEDTP